MVKVVEGLGERVVSMVKVVLGRGWFSVSEEGGGWLGFNCDLN